MKALITSLFVATTHLAAAYSFTGSISVTAGDNGVTYTYNDGIVYSSFTFYLTNGYGVVYGATRSGTTYTCKVDWKTAGSTTLVFSAYGTTKGTRNITVNCPTVSMPTATFSYPNGTTACGSLNITYTASPPTGLTWYWQTSSGGTSTDNPSKTLTVLASGTYYLRARCQNTWSTAKATATVTVNPVPWVSASDKAMCSESGSNFELTNNTPNVTNSWTVTMSGVTGASNGSGISGSSYPYTYTINQSLATTSSVNGTATYVITPTASGCSGSPITRTVTVRPKPAIGAAGQNICSGNTATVNFSNNGVSGIVYYWTVTQTNVTGASTPGSSESSTSQTLSATTNAPGSVTYSVTPLADGCFGAATPVVVNVNPNPTMSIDNHSPYICSGWPTNISYSSPVSGTNFTWAISPSNVSGAQSMGSPTSAGSVVQYLSSQNGVAQGSVYYYFQSSATFANGGTCTSGGSTTVTVKPIPSVSAPGQTVCSGNPVNITLATNGVGGTTYNWSVTQTNVTGASTPGSSATSTSQTLSATSNSPGSAKYTVIPVANGCGGDALDIVVGVNPNPVISLNNLSPTFCSGSQTNITFSSPVSGTSFTWSVSPSNATGAQAMVSPTPAGTISQTVSSQDGVTSGSVVYNLQSVATFANGGTCASAASTNVSVKPKPAANTLSKTFFNGSTGSVTLSSSISGSTFSYTASSVTNITGSSGGNVNPISQPLALTNNATPGTVIYSVTPTFNGCPGSAANVSVSLYPEPSISASPQRVYMGSTATLTAQPFYDTYNWSATSGQLAGNTSTRTISAPDTYSLRVVKNGVTSTTSASVTISGQFNGQQSLNYILSNKLQTAISDTAKVKLLPVDSVQQSVQYFDGLGRPIESVVTQGSPSKTDIVQVTTYDAYGRKNKNYLPFTSGNNGWYKDDPIGDVAGYTASLQYSFYNNGTDDKVVDDVRPFAETIFENSDLNRPEKDYGSGYAWAPDGNNKYVQHAYLLNANGTTTDREKVIAWKIDATTGLPVRHMASNAFLDGAGYFKDGQLSINSTKDEQGNEAREYTDRSGHVILKKVQYAAAPTLSSKDDWAQTYYIYDDLGRLTFVLQPELSKALHGGTANPTADQLKNLGFRYKYDGRNRMIEKQVPGADTLFMVYDDRDRLVLTQDGNQRNATATKEWTFTKYDALNRPVLTGKYESNNDLTTMQSAVDSFYDNLTTGQAWHDTYIGSTAGNVLGYDNHSFPQVSAESSYYTATYYDQYDSYIAPPGYTYLNESLAGQESGGLTTVKGQVTGSKVKNLTSGAWLRTVNYYDDRYRITQTVGDHQKGTIRTSNVYDFAGKIMVSKRTYVVNSTATTIKETYAYDHAGRALNVKHSMNGNADVIMVKNEYNEIGQLVDKNLHSTDGGASFAQSIDHRYNIRGWLTKINEADVSSVASGDAGYDYFGMELTYNNTVSGLSTTPVYNGNISAIQWSKGNGGSVGKQAYTFTYDPMNRLEEASHFDYEGMLWAGNNRSFQEKVNEYDLNGNIMKLSRREFGGMLMDSLLYGYTGNRLNYVHDYGNPTEGFVNTNTGTDDYDYDFNGNLDKDRNKGLLAKGDIRYNYLNLPEEVIKGTESIKYIYDATGRKLAQEVYSNNGGSLVKTTDYIGELVYEDNSLQFAQTSEGRVLPDGSAWEYQYHLKDHLGNVRVTFTTKPQATVSYAANLETGTGGSGEGVFGNYSSSVYDLVDHTDAGSAYQKVQWLNGGASGRVGLTKSLSVMPGDRVSVTAYAKYMNLAGTGNTNAFAAALTAAFGVSSGSTGEQLKLYNGLNDYGLAVAGGDHPDDDDTAPKAFVTILLFDHNYNLLDAAWDQVTTDMEQVSATQKEPFAYPLSKEVVVHEPGFAYIFVSNEHPTYVDVYFDDVRVTHTPSPIVSASDYYPFGLTFNSFERENSVEQRWKFQGQEHIDDLGLNWDSFKWRNHQPDIGRFFNIDPLADKYVYNSPYAFSENKVISSKELEGLEAEPINESAEIRDVRVEPNWNREDPSKVDSYTATFTLVQSKTYNTYDENNVSTSTVKQVSTSQHSVVLPPGGMTMDSSKEGYANTVNMPVKGSMAVVVTTTTTTSTSSEGKNNSSTKKELKPTGDFRLSKANTAKVREAVVAKGQSNSLLVEKFVRFIFSEKKEKKKRTTTSEHHY